MVLAARPGAVRERHLAAVEEGEPQVTLAGKLAAAQAAVAAPQRRVSELEAALAAAVEAPDFAAAARIQEELPAARERLALAEVEVRVIGEAQAAVNAAADAERRRVAEAQQREELQRVLEAALAAEQQALGQIDAALGVMRGHLAAAKGALQRAGSHEGTVLEARRRAIEARRALGEFPPGHPGPQAAGAGRVQSVIGGDPLIAELARWRG
jgi:hypothetical protein